MLMWTLILIAVVAVLIAVGMILGKGSRSARQRGLDRSEPAAKVRVIEHPH